MRQDERRGRWVIALSMAILLGCATGDDGGGGGGGGVAGGGLSGNFVPDTNLSCPSAADSLSLVRQSAVGRIVEVGLRVVDCDQSLGVFGTTFEVDFDPSMARCTSTNPCSAGTLLGQPLATPAPVCVCDNNAGHLIGSFSKVSPGGTESVASSGTETIASFSMEILQQGLGRVDFVNTGSTSGTSLVTLSSGSAVAISPLNYVSGATLGQ